MADIGLRNREGRVIAVALVDDADYAEIGHLGWCLNANGYAWRNSVPDHGEAAHVYLHRQLMGLHAGDVRQVDHINRDKLDNRRANLRFSDNRTNKQNIPAIVGSSRHRGVSYDRSRDKWIARVQLDGQPRFFGRFATEIEAAEAASRFRAEFMPYSDDARVAS